MGDNISQNQREKKIIQTSFVGIGGNILLVGFKAFVGIISHSVAIITDAINNLTDALSSIITIVGTKLANKKPDRKHPYGHGRIEYITSTLIAFIILFAGAMAIYESIQSLIEFYTADNPVEVTYNVWSFVIISAAILVKLGLGLYFRIVGKKVNSGSLKASGIDALWDAALSTSTLVAIFITYFAGFNIEPYLGIVIGLFILRSGFMVLKESFSAIIGERADPRIVANLKKLVKTHPEVKGVYDVILNSYGPDKIIASVHVELDDDVTAREIHNLTRQITIEAYLQLGIVLSVGIYASNTTDEHSNQIRKDLNEIAFIHKTVEQIHAFYVDEEKKQISFDIVFSFEEKNPEGLLSQIVNSLMEKYPDYTFAPVIDIDFSLDKYVSELEEKNK